MKKLSLVVLVLGVGLIFSACRGNTKGHETEASSTTELVTMKPVDNINTTIRSEVTEKVVPSLYRVRINQRKKRYLTLTSW